VLGDRGWVTLLGVRADSRGRGIAAALLRDAFAGFAARGTRTILLAVDAANPTGATALYERLGMDVVKRFDVWERPLDRSARSRLS
jgi:mycothiol synthase